jgi:hypothetical protein
MVRVRTANSSEGMMRRAIVFASLILFSNGAAGSTLGDFFRKELAEFERAEQIFIIKIAENKIKIQLKAAGEAEPDVTESMKIASYSYAQLAYLLNKAAPRFAELYKERSEFYEDYVLERLTSQSLRLLEDVNERKKTSAFSQNEKLLAPSGSDRKKELLDYGDRLGSLIHAAAADLVREVEMAVTERSDRKGVSTELPKASTRVPRSIGDNFRYVPSGNENRPN